MQQTRNTVGRHCIGQSSDDIEIAQEQDIRVKGSEKGMETNQQRTRKQNKEGGFTGDEIWVNVLYYEREEEKYPYFKFFG